MVVLNRGTRNLRLGVTQVDAIYAGVTKVWPPLPSYLNLAGAGYASTPGGPELTIASDVRVTAMVRDDSAESVTVRDFIRRVETGSYTFRILATSNTFHYVQGFPSGATTPVVGSNIATRTDFGTTPPGTDRWIGVDITGVHDGPTALQLQAVESNDGLTWLLASGARVGFNGEGFSRETNDRMTVGVSWIGRIYWAQMDAINRAHLVFPGVIGNMLSLPLGTGIPAADTRQIVVRVSADDWDAPVPPLPDAFSGIVYRASVLGLRRSGTRVLHCYWYFPGSGSTTLSLTYPAGLFAPGQSVWLRFTVGTTVATAEYSLADTLTEPTSWTHFTFVPPPMLGGHPIANGTLFVGADSTGTSRPWAGKIRRVIIRENTGLPNIVDVYEDNAGHMTTPTTFTATSGQVVTVTTTAGNQIVQPIPDNLMWRFDAAEHERGNSWTGPRGRTWTVTNPAAIVHPT